MFIQSKAFDSELLGVFRVGASKKVQKLYDDRIKQFKYLIRLSHLTNFCGCYRCSLSKCPENIKNIVSTLLKVSCSFG